MKKKGNKMTKEKEYLKTIKEAIDYAIKQESKDIKPNEKIKVSITSNDEGIVVNARKVKK